MKTKVITKTKVQIVPKDVPFSARMELYPYERNLFMSGKRDEFEAFKELMNSPLHHLQWKEVQGRTPVRRDRVTGTVVSGGNPAFEMIEKPVIDPATGQPKMMPRAKKPVMEKVVKVDDDGVPIPVVKNVLLPGERFKKNEEYLVDTSKVIYPKSGKEEKRIVPVTESYTANKQGRFECDKPVVGKITTEKRKGKLKGQVVEDDVSGPGHELQIRVTGPIDDVRKVSRALVGVPLGEWDITTNDVGLDKFSVSENDRNGGAWCSDTIRAYINPKRKKDVKPEKD